MATTPQPLSQVPILPPITNTPFVNSDGFLTPVALNVIQQIWAAAFEKGLLLLGYADGINFNVSGDTPISIALPTNAIGWRANLGLVWGTQGGFSVAKAGIFSAPFGQGMALIGQTALSGITATGSNTVGAVTSLTPTQSAIWTYQSLYLNVGTRQGGTSLGNFYLYGYPVF